MFQRQVNREGGMASVAFTLDQALVLADDVLGNGQAQPGTVRAATDHGIEEGFLQFRRDAWAVVDDLYPRYQAVTHVADGELAQGAAAQVMRPRRSSFCELIACMALRTMLSTA